MQKYVIVGNGKQLQNITALDSWRRKLTLPGFEVCKQKVYLLYVDLSSMDIVYVPIKQSFKLKNMFLLACLWEKAVEKHLSG